MRVQAKAEQDIPFGALVLVRGGRVSLASEDIANARAVARPAWSRDPDEVIRKGQYLSCEMLPDAGARNLQAIADGPIMEPTRIYLPAGKVSEDEWRQRTFEQFAASGIADVPELPSRKRKSPTTDREG